jgi:glucokinase
MNEETLCFDLGGTKLACALVDRNGYARKFSRVLVPMSRGFDGVIDAFQAVSREHFSTAQITSVAVSSAGPLDPATGILLDPTNFLTAGQSWGLFPLKDKLNQLFDKPVMVENDAACAVLAEVWKGKAQGFQNVLVFTLGTGLGVGVISNGELVRAGRGLHPEGGHLSMNAWSKRRCACGARGCAEAYLSGSNFVKEVGSALGLPALTGEELVLMAEVKDPRVEEWMQIYAKRLALAIRMFSMIYAPEIVVLAGGFASAAPYFLPRTEELLVPLFKRYSEGVNLLPKVRVSRFKDEAGVIGAARAQMLRAANERC